jgi:hypothetical protein
VLPPFLRPARRRSIPSLPAEDGSRQKRSCRPEPPARAATRLQLHSPRGPLGHQKRCIQTPRRCCRNAHSTGHWCAGSVSESHVENSPPCYSRRAFGPSKRPFTRLLLRACGPWVRIAPPLLLGLRHTRAFRAALLDSPGEGRPRPHATPRRRARRGHAGLRLGCCSLGLHRSRLPPMPSRRTASKNALRRPEPPARAANRPQLHSPRGPSRLRYPVPPWLRPFPRCPDLFTLDKLPRQRDHRFTNTPRGTHGGIHHVIVSRARSTKLASWHRPLSLARARSTDALATSQQGLAPDPRCARAGEAQGVGWMSPSAKRAPG